MYLLLEDIKKQCIIEHDEDDAYLMQIASAAEGGMASFIGQSLEDVTDENGLLPTPLYQALLMMVGEMYSHREVTVSYQQYENAAFRFLVQPFIKY